MAPLPTGAEQVGGGADVTVDVLAAQLAGLLHRHGSLVLDDLEVEVRNSFYAVDSSVLDRVAVWCGLGIAVTPGHRFGSDDGTC